MKEFNLVDLEEKNLKDLVSTAKEIGITEEDIQDTKKQNLIFKVLEAQAKKNGQLFSEGVL